MDAGLQPSRVPTGWRVDRNTPFEEDPTEPADAAGYDHGGTDRFQATHASRRRTEDDRPTVGRCPMLVLRMVESDPADAPGRRPQAALEVSWDDPIHEFETASGPDLVAGPEAWLARRSRLARIGPAATPAHRTRTALSGRDRDVIARGRTGRRARP